MIDERLETRLRRDPTNDRRHEVGMFRHRLSDAAMQRVSPRPVLRVGFSVGAVLALVLVVALLLGTRPSSVGPSPSSLAPSPSPSASGSPSRSAGADIQPTVDEWAAANGSPPVLATVVGPTGELWSAGAGFPVDATAAGSSVRLGETARMFLVNAVLALDECGRGRSLAPCRPDTAMGRFSLDDRVSAWLPDWPPSDATTIRELLEGSSGLDAVGPTIGSLRDRIGAEPTADWSRDSLISVAVGEPRRFVPGTARDAVDTDYMLLEDIVASVTQAPAGAYIDEVAGHAFGPLGQASSAERPASLVPGNVAGDDRLTDLEPGLLAIVGDQDGIAASSEALARLAVQLWGTAISHEPAGIDYLTDVANGHSNPIAGRGACPCTGANRSVIVATGHAVGWSSAAAYSFDRHAAIGVTLARDVPDDALDALIERLFGVIPANR